MNDFEKRLLSHGTFNRTDGEIQTKMALETEALRQAGKPQRLVESSEDYHRRLASWLKYYSGKIPESWEDPHGIVETIRRASGEGIDLSPTLAEAVLTHPMAYPLQRLSASQRLTASQLAIVIARPELPNYVKDSVSVNQRILQVPHSVWREAGRIARVERQSLIPHLNVNLGSS